jgi:hypothetical protein
MVARLGNVLYWAACIFAVLCIAIGWVAYEGVDTTGIEAARQKGSSDIQILQQRKIVDQSFGYDAESWLHCYLGL